MKPFLIRQPIWQLNVELDADTRWEIGVMEDDPSDEGAKMPLARMSPKIDPDFMDREKADEIHKVAWQRMERETMITHATRSTNIDHQQRDPSWHRVALISSAGLGKSTNLKWLAAHVNAVDGGRGSVFAFFIELDQLATGPNEVEKQIFQWIIDQGLGIDVERITESVRRLLYQGRVLFLLDSLDQANPSPSSNSVQALTSLLHGAWKHCPVWVSGRPYAFRIAQSKLRENVGPTDWRFLRVGLLNEPECRQLLEMGSRVEAK